MANNNNICPICANGVKANTPCVGGVCKQKSCKSCVNKWRGKQVANKVFRTCAHCRADNLNNPLAEIYASMQSTTLTPEGEVAVGAFRRLMPLLEEALGKGIITLHELKLALGQGARDALSEWRRGEEEERVRRNNAAQAARVAQAARLSQFTHRLAASSSSDATFHRPYGAPLPRR